MLSKNYQLWTLGQWVGLQSKLTNLAIVHIIITALLSYCGNIMARDKLQPNDYLVIATDESLGDSSHSVAFSIRLIHLLDNKYKSTSRAAHIRVPLSENVVIIEQDKFNGNFMTQANKVVGFMSINS